MPIVIVGMATIGFWVALGIAVMVSFGLTGALVKLLPAKRRAPKLLTGEAESWS